MELQVKEEGTAKKKRNPSGGVKFRWKKQKEKLNFSPS